MPGGVVNYAGIALQSLGLKTAVITKAANVDADEILGQLRKLASRSIGLLAGRPRSLENNYSGNGLEFRSQKVRAIANTFDPRCLPPVWAKTFYLGPLANGEMSAEFVKAVSERDGRVFLDVQGFLREVENGKVRLVDWPEKREVLAHVHVLKANLAEARFLSGEKEPERAARKACRTRAGGGHLDVRRQRFSYPCRGAPLRHSSLSAAGCRRPYRLRRHLQRRLHLSPAAIGMTSEPPAGSRLPWRRSNWNVMDRSRATRKRSKLA